jgi:protein-L-isoaspartate O-methyltransferase
VVIPVRTPFEQHLVFINAASSGQQVRSLGECRFVPLNWLRRLVIRA